MEKTMLEFGGCIGTPVFVVKKEDKEDVKRILDLNGVEYHIAADPKTAVIEDIISTSVKDKYMEEMSVVTEALIEKYKEKNLKFQPDFYLDFIQDLEGINSTKSYEILEKFINSFSGL